MTKDEALKLALEALDAMANEGWLLCGPEGLDNAQTKCVEAITAIKEALAQPEPWEKFCDSNCVWTDHHPDCKLADQKPVAWMYEVNGAHTILDLFEPPDDAYDEGTLHPLYTRPVKHPTEVIDPDSRTISVYEQPAQQQCFYCGGESGDHGSRCPAQQELEQDEHAPNCGSEEFMLRGILASEIKCWHRLTGDEAQNLLDFVRNMPNKPAQQESKQSDIFCGVDFADGLLSVSVLRRLDDDVAELLHSEQIALPAQQEQKPTCKQSLQVWVIPSSGQFSWEPQDERFWTRMEPAIKQSLTTEQPAPEPVIDKSAAIRIATALGWEPKREPLTDVEIKRIYETSELAGSYFENATEKAIAVARAIEAAHGITGEKK